MARTDTAARIAALETAIAQLTAALTAAPARAERASSHRPSDKTLACTATPPCAKKFAYASGLAWHVANIDHTPKA